MHTSPDASTFISRQMRDPILERRRCRWTGKQFPVYEGDRAMLDKLAPTINGQQVALPLPDVCPQGREMSRMLWRNERKLYRQQSALSGNRMLSCYHPDLPFAVAASTEIQSDDYDPFVYGSEYDMSQAPLAQYDQLLHRTPRIAQVVIDNENSPYTNYAGYSKNVYLSADVMHSDGLLYSNNIKWATNCMDIMTTGRAEFCYQCIGSGFVYRCRYSYFCKHCNESGFLYDCHNCDHCYLCSNLHGKSYRLMNQPSSKEEIEQFRQSCRSYKNFVGYSKQFQELITQTPKRALFQLNCDHCTGNDIGDSRHAHLCHYSNSLQDCRYCLLGHTNQDCMDTTIFNPGSSLVYQAVCGGGNVHRSMAVALNREVNQSFYSEFCMNTEHNWLSANLFHQQYCILNKSYEPAVYHKLTEHIAKQLQESQQRGSFFPTTMAPFPYNDTVADDYYPVHSLRYPDGSTTVYDPDGYGTVTIHQPDQAISAATLDWGAEPLTIKRRTTDQEVNLPADTNVYNMNEVPDSIDAVGDDWSTRIVRCPVSGRPFRYVAQEIALCRQLGVPLLRVHYDVRHKRRCKYLLPRKLQLRPCSQTGETILSAYGPDVSFPVYSTKAYEQVVYS